MTYADPRKQSALTAGLTLITAAVFGFMLLSFTPPQGDVVVATMVVDGKTVEVIAR